MSSTQLLRASVRRPRWRRAAPLLLLLATTGLAAQVIPPERLLPFDPGVRGGIPAVPYRLDVRDFGAAGDGATDDGPAFNAAIAAAPTPGFVWVPPGIYRIATIIQMRSGVVLQGAGPASSRLLFDLGAYGFRGGIELTGSMDALETPAVGGYLRGSTTLTLESAAGVAPGSVLWLFQDDDEPLMYTADYWRTDYAVHSMGQVIGVAAVDGDTLTLDVPLRLDYKAALNPRVRAIHPIENAGVEGLYLERLDNADAYTVSMTYAQNCWLRYLESRLSYRAHLWAFYSRFLTVTDSYFHEAHDYGDGGHGYGITLADCTSDSLVTNNIFRSLRHSTMVKEGANGNVVSYNYSFDRRQGKADGALHGHYNYGNLFEGNVFEELIVSDWWGPSGPLTTVFRNRLASAGGISVRDHSDFTNVVGNTTRQVEVRKGPDIILLGYPIYMGEVKDELVDGNLIGGQIVWQGDPLPIPASHYLAAPPEFWGTRPWPSIGADVDLVNDPDLEIPAQVRHRLIQNGQWRPPVPEILTQEPLVAGNPATLTVINADPGERVYFLASVAGEGEGPCFAALGGLCVDLLAPRLLGSATADAGGTATFVLQVPGFDPPPQLSTQAVVPRGERSTKTNAITAPVEP